jgi:hypothetical protein
LLFSCHATQWLFQADYDELMALARATVWQAERLTERATAALVARTHLPADTLSVVLNPLAYERTATVPLLLTFVHGEDGGVPPDLRLVDGAGREVPFQVTNELRHDGVRWEVEALARLALPAGGSLGEGRVGIDRTGSADTAFGRRRTRERASATRAPPGAPHLRPRPRQRPGRPGAARPAVRTPMR